MTLAALVVLADGRFPGGAHAHSAGVESAIDAGLVADVGDLAHWLDGRLATAAPTEAALAAATVLAVARAAPEMPDWAALDRAAGARTASPALRAASRRLGRQLLRAGRVAWPGALLDSLVATCPGGPAQPVALGAAAAAAGLTPEAAALAAAHGVLATPAGAAVRLLGLDPFAVHALLAARAGALDAVAARAAGLAAGSALRDLPAPTGSWPELAAEHHAARDARLFAS